MRIPIKRVVCIGDSLSLPGHLNQYEDTWIYKLKLEFPDFDFISFFKRQLTTDALATMGGGKDGIDNWPKGADCLEAYRPDIVIVQLGIVDCAPRLMNKYDKAIMKILPFPLLNPYIRLIKKFRERKIDNTMVSLNQFRNNWINYIDRTVRSNVRVIIISISLPDSAFLTRNPQIHINVKRYNDFLFQLIQKYPNVSVTEALNSSNYDQPIYEDGYHPNQFGHKLIFSQLRAFLK